MGFGLLPALGVKVSAQGGSEVKLAGRGGHAWETWCGTIHEDAWGMAELTVVAGGLSCVGWRGNSEAR